MRPNRVPRKALGVALLAGGVGGFVACYGPTEVLLEITRDVSCSPRGEATTGIFVGPRGHGPIDAVAETDDCTDLNEGRLASSIARVTVEVAVALAPRNPSDARKTPRDCLLDAKDCIVARRSFAFIPHASRTIPIELYEECRDRTCLPGTTCVANACRSDDIDADEFCDSRESCKLPPAEAGADAPLADAAAVDAGGADAGPCTGTSGGIVADGVAAPSGRIVATANDLLRLAGDGSSLNAAPKTGLAAPRVLYAAAAGTMIAGFAINETRTTAWLVETNGVVVEVTALDGATTVDRSSAGRNLA